MKTVKLLSINMARLVPFCHQIVHDISINGPCAHEVPHKHGTAVGIQMLKPFAPKVNQHLEILDKSVLGHARHRLGPVDNLFLHISPKFQRNQYIAFVRWRFKAARSFLVRKPLWPQVRCKMCPSSDSAGWSKDVEKAGRTCSFVIRSESSRRGRLFANWKWMYSKCYRMRSTVWMILVRN